MICLDERYSTTRIVTPKPPLVENKLEDKYKTLLFLPLNENRIAEGGLRTKGFFKQNIPGKPLISVITTVLNGDKYLEETIQSVVGQTYDNVEYIIIDGGSTQKTLDIIFKYDHLIDYWVSEEDSGIYDAMNKGIKLSQGSYVGIINSDDYYQVDAIERMLPVFRANLHSPLLICGGMDIIDGKGGLLYSIIRTELSLRKKYRFMPFNHPATFVSKEIYKHIGAFNLNYRISADYEFILRAIEAKQTILFLSEKISVMREGGVSDNLRSLCTSSKEEFIFKKHYIGSFRAFFYVSLKIISILLRRSFPKRIVNIISQKRYGIKKESF